MALTKATNSLISGAVANVLDFGADPSGSTDSTSAIQAAIDSCATTDRTEGIPNTPVSNQVHIPAGTYLVSASLNVTSYLNITGAGRQTTFIKSSITNGTAVFNIQYSTSGLSQNYNRISDFTINGQGNNTQGIYVAFANRFELSSVQVMKCANRALYLQGGVINTINNFYSWDCGSLTESAVLLYGASPAFGPNATTFMGGEVYASPNIGMHVQECVSLNVCGMTFQANEGNAILVTNGLQIQIDGCYFEVNKDDIKLLNTVSCSVTNNLFALPKAGYTAFIVLNKMTNGEIYGNEFQVGKNAIGQTTEIGSLLFDQSHVGNNFGTQPLPIDAAILALANNNGSIIERWDATSYGNAVYGRNIFKSRTYHDDSVYMLTAGDTFNWIDSGVIWRTGTGSPEGGITAPVGSMFTRSDGGTSTTLYVKESGTGNTGWVAK